MFVEEMEQKQNILDTLERVKLPETDRFANSLLINGHTKVFYLYDYVPQYRTDIVRDYRMNQVTKLVLQVKEGEPVAAMQAARQFMLAIENERLTKNPGITYLVPVPASNPRRHERRFKHLCRYLSELLRINDGYGLVSVGYGQPKKGIPKLSGHPHWTLGCDKNLIAGKKFLLIDDVVTTGQSLDRLSRELKGSGARSVHGIVIARTIPPAEK